MEVKTCEEYLVRELEQLTHKVESLEQKNKEQENTIVYLRTQLELAKTSRDIESFVHKDDYSYRVIKEKLKEGTPLFLCGDIHLKAMEEIFKKHNYEDVVVELKRRIEEESKLEADKNE